MTLYKWKKIWYFCFPLQIVFCSLLNLSLLQLNVMKLKHNAYYHKFRLIKNMGSITLQFLSYVPPSSTYMKAGASSVSHGNILHLFILMFTLRLHEKKNSSYHIQGNQPKSFFILKNSSCCVRITYCSHIHSHHFKSMVIKNNKNLSFQLKGV